MSLPTKIAVAAVIIVATAFVVYLCVAIGTKVIEAARELSDELSALGLS